MSTLLINRLPEQNSSYAITHMEKSKSPPNSARFYPYTLNDLLLRNIPRMRCITLLRKLYRQ
jgi:hypothetical protein